MATGYGTDAASGRGGYDAAQAAQHAYWSAWMYMNYGEETATAIANIHETYGSIPNDPNRPFDSARDQWNNEWGRKIGEQVYDEGYWWTSSRDARIRQLIEEAWKNGNLLTGRDDLKLDEYDLIENEQEREARQRADDAAAAERARQQREAELPFSVIT